MNMNKTEEENYLLKKILFSYGHGCEYCNHEIWINGYNDCDIDWCKDQENFDFNIMKARKEFQIKI